MLSPDGKHYVLNLCLSVAQPQCAAKDAAVCLIGNYHHMIVHVHVHSIILFILYFRGSSADFDVSVENGVGISLGKMNNNQPQVRDNGLFIEFEDGNTCGESGLTKSSSIHLICSPGTGVLCS